MAAQADPKTRQSTFISRFPEGTFGDLSVEPTVLEREELSLEGNDLVVVEVGHGDTDSSTVLHVPSLGLVVAGDVVYNGVHLYLIESTSPESRREWTRALDIVSDLAAGQVIAGHKNPTRDDSPSAIDETRDYIRAYDTIALDSTTAEEVFFAMTAKFPDFINVGALWGSAQTLIKSRG